VQLDAGTSVRALSEHLGHADPGLPCASTPTTSCRPMRTAPGPPSTAPWKMRTRRRRFTDQPRTRGPC